MTNQRGQNSIICILCRYISITSTVRILLSSTSTVHIVCVKNLDMYTCVTFVYSQVAPQFHTCDTKKPTSIFGSFRLTGGKDQTSFGDFYPIETINNGD